MSDSSKPYDAVSDVTKLVISLAAATIAFTVTFTKEAGGVLPRSIGELIMLCLAWASLLLSVGFGIWTLLALVEILEPVASEHGPAPTIRSRRIRVPFQFQLLAFAAGEFAMVFYGFLRLICPGT